LLSLAAFALANIGFLLATSTIAFTVIRSLEGALSAGLYPAAMGVVADLVPRNERGRWIGVVMAGYGAGFILGPVVGGVLYDLWGFAAPFIASASMAALAFVAAVILVPETRTATMRQREKLWKRREGAKPAAQDRSLKATLPKPIPVFAVLLLVEFAIVFAFAFIEPQMVFYLYEDLDWSTVRFGVLVAFYGLSVVIGQLTLSRLADTFNRKLIIIAGLLLNVLFYAALTFVTSFPVLLATAVMSGIGEALILPAVSAFVLDMTSEEHRSRAMGIKESAAALGGVAGPLLVISAASLTTPQGVFAIAATLIVIMAGIAAVDLRAPCLGQECWDQAREYAAGRAAAALASIRGIVTSANTARGL
jgi:MFS family permease